MNKGLKKFLENIFSVKKVYSEDKKIQVIKISGIKIKKVKEIVADLSLYPSPHWYETFYKYLEKETFKDEYLNLIRGLDDESIETVSKILNRIRNYKANGSYVFVLSKDEKLEIDRSQDFSAQIMSLGDNLFAWNKYIMPENWFEYGVFKRKYYIDKFSKIDKNKNILDVGAFIGDSAIVLREFTNKKVYAFEPCQKNYETLLKTLELNGADTVEPVNIALGEENSHIKLYGADVAASVVRERNDNYSEVEIRRLDDWIVENPMEIGLIKVDIEGAEQMFLRGAYNTIKAQRPNMIISIYHGGDDFFRIKPLIESWNLGYKFKIIRTCPQLLSDETVLLCEAG